MNYGNKTANVMARVEPSVKEQAEEIMEMLDIPVSVVINALYKQIIMTRSIPFSLSVPAGFAWREIYYSPRSTLEAAVAQWGIGGNFKDGLP